MGEVTTAQPVNILGRPPQGPGDISTFEEALAYTRLDEAGADQVGGGA